MSDLQLLWVHLSSVVGCKDTAVSAGSEDDAASAEHRTGHRRQAVPSFSPELNEMTHEKNRGSLYGQLGPPL